MNQYLDKIRPFLGKVHHYSGLIVMILFSLMYGFLIYTSSKLAQELPSEAQINEKFQGAKRPKIDKSVAEQLSKLEDQNIQTKAIFDEARKNPFSE